MPDFGDLSLDRRSLLASGLLSGISVDKLPLSGKRSKADNASGSDEAIAFAPTFSAAEAATYPASVLYIITAGYHEFGSGAAVYERVPLAKALPGAINTADGSVFNLSQHNARISPEQFGANGDCDSRKPPSDDSKALSVWFNFCIRARRKGTLTGQYLVEQNNVFANSDPSYVQAREFVVEGEGTSLTRILFRPRAGQGVQEYFLRDGLDPSSGKTLPCPLLGLSFSDMTIEIDASQVSDARVGWFRQSGWTSDRDPEQNWTFESVRFHGDDANPQLVGPILAICGNANGSENAFINCFGRRFRNVITCSNPQAVNHSSISCHWELSSGSLFEFIQGGNLTVTGGSLIVGSFLKRNAGEAIAAADVPRQDRIFVLVVGGNAKGQINSFRFSGSRVEMRDNTSGILDVRGPNVRSMISFDGVDFQACSGQPRTTIFLSNTNSTVAFTTCALAAPGGFVQPVAIDFTGGPTQPTRLTNKVTFTSCMLPAAIKAGGGWIKGPGVVALRDCTVNLNAPSASVPLFDADVVAPRYAALHAATVRTAVQNSMFKAGDGILYIDLSEINLPFGVDMRQVSLTCTASGAVGEIHVQSAQSAIPMSVEMRDRQAKGMLDAEGQNLAFNSRVVVKGTWVDRNSVARLAIEYA